MCHFEPLKRWKNIVGGANNHFQNGWVMSVFDYKQAQEVRDAFARHGVRYLFIGKSGAILLGFPDTTQDADLYMAKSSENGLNAVAALKELGFAITDSQKEEITRGKDFIQIKNGPFDLDLIFAPDGIEGFEDAWARHIDVEGFPVCNIDDIIASKQAAHRRKDIESLPRLIGFRDYWKSRHS
ncbi:MAG TPA: hypothetical protein VHD56_14780 [Tepidisphaeraceae bacterium]|nr:hypothetical protein [Tepidisphaeraceae bacterium]